MKQEISVYDLNPEEVEKITKVLKKNWLLQKKN